MKKYYSIFVIMITLNSCIESKKNDQEDKSSTTSELNFESEKLSLDSSNNTLTKWIDFYQEKDPYFSINDFYLQSKDSLVLSQGHVFGNYDGNFDTVYNDFLIHRADKKQYLDIDSYNWSIDENGQPSFSPDQEINLVDVEKKTVKRIAFRGPQQWVEDAFWQNDSIIILLENYDRQPIITKLNLRNNEIQSFIYKDTLNFESYYSVLRFEQKGFELNKPD